MKEAKLLLLFLVVFTILLAGCAILPPPDMDRLQPTNPSASQETEASQAPEPTASIKEEVLISVDFATDELLGQYDAYHEFVDPEEEGPQKIIFTSNMAVEDFSFIEIGHEVEDTTLVIVENRVLHQVGDLSPATPFVVNWTEWGSLPHRGISFKDESGRTRYFYLAMSGEDGSLLLPEFGNE